MKIKHKSTPFLTNISERTLYMKFPFFASFVIFILILQHNINKGKKAQAQMESEFWNRESSANDVRKRSLDDLVYVSFTSDSFYPLNLLDASLSSDFLTKYPEAKEILSRFLVLETKKIVNLSAFSNTDLKFKYGVANLVTLTEYDSNFNELITLLHKYGELFAKEGYESQALFIWEYAVSIGSDISSTYTLCAGIYHKNKDHTKLQWLKKEAESISTSRKDIIVRKLQEFDLCND